MRSNWLCTRQTIVAAAIALAGCACFDLTEIPSATVTELSASTSQTPVVGVAAALQARLGIRNHPAPGQLTVAEQMDLHNLYELERHALLWSNPSGHPSRDANAALFVLEGARGDGLDPKDYGTTRLRHAANALQSAPLPIVHDLVAFDVGLSAGVLRYFRHLHVGRVDPRSIGLRLRVPSEPHDFVAILRAGLANHRIHETAKELAPPLTQYQALRAALAQYRVLARAPDFQAIPASTETIRPGDAYAALDVLYRQLAALGDLPEETVAPTELDRYDAAIVDGVKRFQLRHGLEVDGVLGKQTQAALRVPLAWRIRQLELALERLRWLPDLGERRLIALNIPMFQLWTWDSLDLSGSPSGTMRAIVGRALSTQTPVFAAQMREVIFRPYWNVPRSILRHEILPLLNQSPDYLRQHDMEIVKGAGDNAAPVANTPQNTALLGQGGLRLRQRPGPHNALGLVKFVFPNDADVYMHGTPAQALFSRARRDFSHGCVRVQDPVALAEWVLSQEAGWNRERIVSAMSAPRSQRVSLTEPIDVVLFYTTAAVTGEDRTVRFAEDIYRHDARLDRALTTARSGPSPTDDNDRR